MSRRTLITIVVLAALAGLSFTVTQRRTDPDDGPSEPLPEGYYLTDARLQSTDDAGVLRYELRARRIDQRPSEDAIDLSDLRLDYGNSTNLWRLTAERGRMPADNTHIALEGGVMTQLLNAPAHGATRLRSDRMFVDIAGQTASTDDPVTVEFDGGTLEAVGLDVDLADETLHLRSSVRGVFEPPTR
ncbi:MAG: LPS export ABC transporter periplasmic protein LptC [Pseudomonadota bacterium]